METSLPPEPGQRTWTEQFAALLQGERDRAMEFLADQQAQIERIQSVLEQELSRLEEEAQAPHGDNGRPQSGVLDWEAEKRRILAALECDFDENNADRQAESLKIEDVIRSTEKIVAEKDREIQQLKQRLEGHSREQETASVEAVESSQMFDMDAAVQEEQRRLQQLQDEWREKLRQAEIEVSVERATLARQRAELEDRIRSTGGVVPRLPGESSATEDDQQPKRGRWLAKLGLTEADRVSRRKR
jgi:hypothetical protein